MLASPRSPTPSGCPSYPLRLPVLPPQVAAIWGEIKSYILLYLLPPEGPTLKATGPGKEG